MSDLDTRVDDPPPGEGPATEQGPAPGAEPGDAAPSTGPDPSPDGRRLRLLTHRVTGSSRERLQAALQCEMLDEHDAADDVDLIVVSTRMPLAQASGALHVFRRMRTVPVVAIVHAGGEDLATELLRAGAAGLVAEGNEAAIASFAGRDPTDASLVETYEQRLGRARPSQVGSPGQDPVTGLPGRGDFDVVLGEVTQAGDVPRVGFVRINNYEESVRRLSDEATNLLRRRLGAQFRELGRLFGATLYSWSPSTFTFVAGRLDSAAAGELGHELIRAGEGFAPSGGRPLTVAVGHAGVEVTSEVSAVRELAQRAMELAGTSADSAVLSADDLSRTLAATTELEVLLRMVEVIERQRGTEGRGARVAELAGRLAQQLGFDGLERARIRLAGHLHEIGKIVLGPEERSEPDADADRTGWEQYPARGASYLAVSAGPEVAEAVRHHREHWDGTGFPDGLEAEAIPVGARIVAVAQQLESLGATTTEGPPPDLDPLRERVGTVFDPTVVAAVQSLYGLPRDDVAGLPSLIGPPPSTSD